MAYKKAIFIMVKTFFFQSPEEKITHLLNYSGNPAIYQENKLVVSST